MVANKQNTHWTTEKIACGSAILGDTADELRPNGVAHGKEKHEEDRGLQRRRDGDTNLSDENAGQESGGNRPQTNSLERELPEVISKGKSKEDGDLRVLPESRSEPLKNEHRFAPRCSPVLLLKTGCDCIPAAKLPEVTNQDVHYESHRVNFTSHSPVPTRQLTALLDATR